MSQVSNVNAKAMVRAMTESMVRDYLQHGGRIQNCRMGARGIKTPWDDILTDGDTE